MSNPQEQPLEQEELATATTENEPASTPEEDNIVAEPTDELTQLKAEIAALKDQYLRQAAEFDNYRKRVMREKAELIRNGGEKVICDLLPVLDDFERAQSSSTQTDDAEALKEGVSLILDKLLGILKREGLQKIEAVGETFNVDFHEAIAMVPAQSDEQKGKVVDQVQAGYKLNEKVIRHAKVAVAQ